MSSVLFGILSTTKALLFNSLTALSTSACVAVSLATKAFAVANSAFADSIAEAVFSVDAAFSKAASKRVIAELNLVLSAFLAVSTFSATGLFSLLSTVPFSFSVTSVVAASVVGFVVATVVATASVVGVVLFVDPSAAWTFTPPNTANPDAMATLATPTLNLRIL